METSDLRDRPPGPREESFSVSVSSVRTHDGSVSVSSVRQQISRCEKSNYCQSSIICRAVCPDTGHISFLTTSHWEAVAMTPRGWLTAVTVRLFVCIAVCVSVGSRVCVCVCVCVLHSNKCHVKWEQGEATETLSCVCGRRLDDGGGDGIIGWRGRGGVEAGAKRESSGIRGFKGQLGGNAGKSCSSHLSDR